MKYEVHPMIADMDEKTRAAFLQEMADGYTRMADEADARREECECVKDSRGEREWGADARRYRAMASRVLQGILDEPDTHMSMFSYDEAIGDRRELVATQADVDAETPVDEKEHAALRNVVAAGGVAILSPRQQEVAQVYIGGKVNRSDVAGILDGDMTQWTMDTHVRDIKARWRQVLEVGEASF